MNAPRLKILLIEDDPEDSNLIRELLRSVTSVSYLVEWVTTWREAIETICMGDHDACLLDFRLSARSGLDILREVMTRGAGMPIIVLTGYGGYEVDLEAMAYGAADYLDKSQVNPVILERAIRCAIERKKVEKALRESEGRYRTLFDSASDAIFVHGLDGRILDVNRRACEYLGFSRIELLSQSLGQFGAGSCAESPADKMRHMCERDHLFTETTCTCKDGPPIHVELSSRLITYNSMPAIMSIARDITERKRAEKVVRENLHFLQTLIDTIPNPTFLVSVGGSYQGCNRAFEEYLGRSREEILEHSIYDIYPEHLATKLHRVDQDLFDNPRLVFQEALVPYADGSMRSIIVNKAPYRSTDGIVTGLVGIMMDITHLKNAQRELEEARAKAECARRAKSDFLANVSHELRTPLNAIIGFTGLMLESQPGELSSVQSEYLKDVHTSAQHLLSLVTGMLDFNNLESGKKSLQISEVPVEELLHGSISMIVEQASARGIRIELIAERAPKTIKGDERKLEQVITNLLSNALKFSTDGGYIRVMVKCTDLAGLSERAAVPDGASTTLGPGSYFGYLQLSVTDKGIGIRKDDLERIFDPFEQVDKSLSRKYEGTGLGLALCKKLVELHAGSIWAESEGEGKGSTFHFAIPVNRECGIRGNHVGERVWHFSTSY